MHHLFLKDYWIKEIIWEDHTGKAYRAIKADEEKEVLLYMIYMPSFLLESQRESFVNELTEEINKAKELNHPNIWKVEDFFSEKGKFFIRLPFIEGECLKKIQQKRRSLREIVSIYIQAAQGLKHAHHKGVYHKNISLTSIFIDKEGRVKVFGFGLHLLNRDESLKRVGESFTPPKYIDYLPPEIIEGKENNTPSCDIYSLGAVMYHFLSGYPPFKGNDWEDLRKKILKGERTSLAKLNPEVPDRLCHIIEKSLRLDPQKRYTSTEELISDLEEVSSSKDIQDIYIHPASFSGTSGKAYQVIKRYGRKILKQISHPKSQTKQHIHIAEEHRDISRFSMPQDSYKPKFSPTISPNFIKNVFAIILMLTIAYIIVSVFLKNLTSIKQVNNFSSVIHTPSPSPQMVFPKAEKKSLPSKGTLILYVDVPKAYVVIRRFYDPTFVPIQRWTKEANQMNSFLLPEGTYLLKVSKEKYENFEGRIEIMPRRVKILKVSLEQKSPRLQIVTNPKGAKVFLGNTYYGKTPLYLYNIPYGMYRVTIQKEGYKEISCNIEVSPERKGIINKTLELKTPSDSKKPTYGYISVTSKPKGVKVWVGNKFLGTTPIVNKQCSSGNLTMTLQKKGFKTKKFKITIYPDILSDFHVEMDPILPLSSQKAKPTSKNKEAKVFIDIRTSEGVIYSKYSTKPIILGFDESEITKKVDEYISSYPQIKKVPNKNIANFEIILHFALAVKKEEDKYDITLYQSITAKDVKTDKKIFYKIKKETLPAIKDFSFNPKEYIQENTKKAISFTEEFLGKALSKCQ